MNVQGDDRISKNRDALNMNGNRKETHDLCTVFHNVSIIYPQPFENYPQFKQNNPQMCVTSVDYTYSNP